MNATSSRAHTIVSITLIQKARKVGGQETSKSSIVNLVDLAGSERVASTGAKGDRLKEGAAINQSLSCLGNCIHALAEKAKGTKKTIKVPFRESMLTRLLMNALGGNSKTVMIAAISPADINYDETLSTLRYADRAKEIKMYATVNEDPTEKLIRELRQENERLKQLLEKGTSHVPIPITPGMSEAEIRKHRSKWEESMKANMAENERELAKIKQTYEEKLKEAQKERNMDEQKAEIERLKQNMPHFSNLNFDLLLSGKLVHIVGRGENLVGKGEEANIVLFGPSIQEKHAIVIDHGGGNVTMEKCTNDARILLNGEPVGARALLSHNDRVMFGTTQLYVFKHPEMMIKNNQTYPEISYEMAREEIASKAGINMDADDQSRETAFLNKDIMEVLPGVDEANAISEELDKHVKFEIMLVSPQMLGKITGRTEVYVKMRNLVTGQEYEWQKEKFLNRLFLMKEMFQNYEAGEEWDLPDERDPFTEDSDVEVMIGFVQVFLQPLAYMVEIKEEYELVDYRGTEVGTINVEVVPCSSNGREYTESDDMFVDSPSDLKGKELNFVVKIIGCHGLPSRFFDINCKYKVYLDEEETVTDTISETNSPQFNHKKVFSFKHVTQQLSEYLLEGFITIQVWGTQAVRKSAVQRAKGKNTKEMFQADILKQTNNLMNGFRMNGRTVDPNKQSIIVELLLMKKQQTRQQQRLDNIKKLIEAAERHKKRKVPITVLKDLMSTNSPETANELLSKVPEEQDSDDEEDSVRGSSTCSLL